MITILANAAAGLSFSDELDSDEVDDTNASGELADELEDVFVLFTFFSFILFELDLFLGLYNSSLKLLTPNIVGSFSDLFFDFIGV